MSDNPLDLALAFWKPLVDPGELRALATYRTSGERPTRGIHVLRADSNPRSYRVVDGDTRLLLHAAVYPIREVPASAEVLAEITDQSGNPYSFILWFPEDQCAQVPFDPNEAIESLRWETYMPPASKTVLPPWLLSAYYAVRPLVPVSLKLALRRRLARGTDPSEHVLDWPTDRSLDLLLQMILRLALMVSEQGSLPFVWFWPEGHPWAAVLTHDVETARGLARVPHVMEIETARRVRSSFNFVPRDYEVDEALLAEMRDTGFEIGVHGYTHDGLLFSRWSTFLQRAEAINEYGRRWGAAGFRSPATFRRLEWFHMLDFEYDSSVTDTAPYEPQPGGCASLFPYLVGDIVEMPMTLPQDHTLFGLLGQVDSHAWITKLDQIRTANGMACVLTHPDPGDGYIGQAENESHYVEVLDYIAASDAWTPLPRELARWWRARSASAPGQTAELEGAAVGIASLDAENRLVIAPPARP